ncbi:hypothetical protein WJX72_005491 [[Myrmecia] bisecta]|uniref:Phosphodiesterase n=1 Tax=[Myrmecia] bisecta TaxID=41462 RepID=A0AAW1R6D0_9CHLO
MTRLLRVVKITRALRLGAALLRWWRGAAADDQPQKLPTNMGKKLAEMNTLQVALLNMITVTMVILLQYEPPYEVPEAFVSSFEPLVGWPSVELQPLVDNLFSFFDADRVTAGRTPVILTVGQHTWDRSVQLGGFTGRSTDRLTVFSANQQVSLVLNAQKHNHEVAYLNILLALFVVFELGVFIAVLNNTALTMLVKPLERIVDLLRTNAKRVLSALEVQQDWDHNEIKMIEAAVVKMVRIVQHVDSSGGQGLHLLQGYLDDVKTDNLTREWLSHIAADTDLPAEGPEAMSDRRTTGEVPTPHEMQHLRTLKAITSVRDREQAQVAASTAHPDAKTDAMAGPAALHSMRIRRLIHEVDGGILDSWDFDVFFFTPEQLVAHVCVMFMRLGLTATDVATFSKVTTLAATLGQEGSIAAFAAALEHVESQPGYANEHSLVNIEVLWNFVEAVSKVYQHVPYHNLFHCMDVTHATYRFLMLTRERMHMTRLEQLSVLLAAVSHDMDHPGLTNAFLINSRHELARTYNDSSVLENRHIASLYSLVVTNPDLDVFRDIDKQMWKDARKLVINCIIHTDMMHHFPMVSKVEVFFELHQAALRAGSSACEAGGMASAFAAPEDRLFLLAVLLHCADISNAVKPISISEKWADRVLEEFFAQGDREKAAGLPVSPMMDRKTTSRSMSQINFIEFIVAPLFAQVVKIFPELKVTVHTLWDNRRTWNERYLQEVAADTSKSAPEKEAERAEFSGA